MSSYLSTKLLLISLSTSKSKSIWKRIEIESKSILFVTIVTGNHNDGGCIHEHCIYPRGSHHYFSSTHASDPEHKFARSPFRMTPFRNDWLVQHQSHIMDASNFMPSCLLDNHYPCPARPLAPTSCQAPVLIHDADELQWDSQSACTNESANRRKHAS